MGFLQQNFSCGVFILSLKLAVVILNNSRTPVSTAAHSTTSLDLEKHNLHGCPRMQKRCMAKYSGTYPYWRTLKSIYQSYPRLLRLSSGLEKNTIQPLFGLHHLTCAEMQHSFMHTPVVRCFLEKLSSAHSANTNSMFQF